MQAARFGVREHESRARARDADVGETAFFFEAARFLGRFLARKQAVFEADQEHQRKLETLRRMQRHQLHAVFPRFALPFAGFERGVREERGELGETRFEILGRALETARDVDQLVEVLDARFGAAAAVLS